MAQPETNVSNAIRRRLGGPKMDGTGGLRCITVKMHGSAYTRKGFPDLLVVRPDGVTVYLEVKVPGRTDGPEGDGLSPLQLRWQRELAKRGAIVGHADSIESALEVVFPEGPPA